MNSRPLTYPLILDTTILTDFKNHARPTILNYSHITSYLVQKLQIFLNGSMSAD
ncbi:TPA: hypothetical protein U1Z95_001638 [Streptococcus suis]|nr:hypothetical protein [Streptococcus suis]HEM4610093.1 hypothetical protein [Streptococcus suis]